MTEVVPMAVKRGSEPDDAARSRATPGAERSDAPDPPPTRARQVVPTALAVVLLVAAGLKAESVLGSRGTGAVDASGILALTAAAVECAIAAWLLSGWAPVAARRVAMGLLGVFAAVAGWRLVGGAADCRCFGRLHVHPAWTFSFDLLALLGLWTVGRDSSRTPAGRGRSAQIAWALLITATVPVATFFFAWRWLEARALGGGGGAELVVLEPETWVGKPLPVLEYVADRAARAELGRGRWTVVLFNRDCHVCEEHLLRLASEARDAPARDAADRLRVIDVAPPGAPRDAGVVPAALKQVALRQDVQYIVEVPVELTIADGVVQGVHRQ